MKNQDLFITIWKTKLINEYYNVRITLILLMMHLRTGIIINIEFVDYSFFGGEGDVYVVRSYPIVIPINGINYIFHKKLHVFFNLNVQSCILYVLFLTPASQGLKNINSSKNIQTSSD